MANWTCASRTNYFLVKDTTAFIAWANKLGLDHWIKKQDDVVFYAVAPGDDEGHWGTYYDEEADDHVDYDITTELAQHLPEDQIAVIMSSGAEKLRYITGWAIAVNHKGETVQIDLDDIYPLAKEKFGIEPSSATY